MTRAEKESSRRIDRAQGCLVGLAIGDALGATVEFLDPAEIKAQFGVHKNLCGEGWLRLQPGEVTDDTQTAKILAESLLEKGRFDPSDLGKRLVAWLDAKPIDVGAAEKEGIERIAGGVDPLESGLSGEQGSGNGSAVRGIPAGIRFYKDKRALRAAAFGQSSLTHLQEDARWGSYLVASLVAWFLEGYSKEETLRLAKAEFKAAPSAIFASLNAPLNRDKPTSFIGDTLLPVFYDFFSCADFESTLVSVVNRGGDSDTAGAIAGALAGAHYGFSQIPPRWSEGVQWSREMLRLGKKLLEAADADRRKS